MWIVKWPVATQTEHKQIHKNEQSTQITIQYQKSHTKEPINQIQLNPYKTV